ncbi:DUF5719 family protein [Glutamicibacter sp. JL.03c]|uniref:DUF5719 family protein n=1 Tax=Glutamicibacter sp. JL.03c TaxID=2984842 RepID=UPI0021F758B3|nr:DUF5719 family protein [Glutamicibacter sp. JL.03c]UYQ78290.1 DUF5719 family protein [Glutamicibacter sp. JL.03c]
MSDEKNVNSADSADKPAEQVPSPKPAASPQESAAPSQPVSAALSRAEQKAAKAKAKVDAKLEKARAKEAQQRAKMDAKNAAKEQKAQAKETAKPAAAPAAAPETEPAEASEPSSEKPSKAAGTPAAVAEPASGAKPGDTSETEDQPAAAPAQDPASSEAHPAHQAASSSTPFTPAAAHGPKAAHKAEPEQAESGKASADKAETPADDSGQAAQAAVATPAATTPAAASRDNAEEPENAKVSMRRRKLEKIRAAEAAKEEQAHKAQATEASPASESTEGKVNARRKKLETARIAASKDAAAAPARRKTGAVLLSLAAVIAAGAVVAGGSVVAPKAAERTLPAAVTNLPAGDASSICAPTPQLLKGVDGTDPQFAAGAKEVSSNLRGIAVSDLAKRIPGSSFAKLDGSSERSLTERIAEAEALEARGSDDDGQTGRTSKISTINDVDDAQVYSLQPLGGLASEGSALRSYQAKDGDLAGLATATCQAPASNWRFTGLQTSTGSTSVMNLSNPTHTTAQISVRLRGPEGLIDTPTLQSIVLAPGQSRALVLGGYAQNMDSVSAEVTSVGGKITASVQQAALRGLTPSGVDFVAPNASASNTQVIPGVWIDEKSNADALSKEDSSLVPQLHVSATGSSGAGYKVKVLGKDGEVAASFDDNLAVASNATDVQSLKQLAGGYYTIVVESDAPVTAAVRMVRGSNPKDSSDTAWAASSNVLAGTQAMPLPANGTGKFSLAAVDSDSSVEATVVHQDGKLSKGRKLEISAGSSIVFDPKTVADDAQAVIFSTDANTFIGAVTLSSERSIAWAAMPQANAGRDGIVVNIGG